jgi:hypothetical protein
LRAFGVVIELLKVTENLMILYRSKAWRGSFDLVEVWAVREGDLGGGRGMRLLYWSALPWRSNRQAGEVKYLGDR